MEKTKRVIFAFTQDYFLEERSFLANHVFALEIPATPHELAKTSAEAIGQEPFAESIRAVMRQATAPAKRGPRLAWSEQEINEIGWEVVAAETLNKKERLPVVIGRGKMARGDGLNGDKEAQEWGARFREAMSRELGVPVLDFIQAADVGLAETVPNQAIRRLVLSPMKEGFSGVHSLNLSLAAVRDIVDVAFNHPAFAAHREALELREATRDAGARSTDGAGQIRTAAARSPKTL